MGRNITPNPKPWLTQLSADQKALNGQIELGPKATKRLLTAIAALPPEKRDKMNIYQELQEVVRQLHLQGEYVRARDLTKRVYAAQTVEQARQFITEAFWPQPITPIDADDSVRQELHAQSMAVLSRAMKR